MRLQQLIQNKNSFEPDLNQRPMDIWQCTTTVHRSTNWAIEGLTSNLVHNTQVTLIGWQWPSKPELCWYRLSTLLAFHTEGDVAQMVERSLSMWEVGGSIPPVSKIFFSISSVLERENWSIPDKQPSMSVTNVGKRKNNFRSRQDSNLRSQRETDF